MIVVKKRKSIVKIVAAINTMLLSECCHSYLAKYIIAPFGEKRNKNLNKMQNFFVKKSKKNLNLCHKDDGKVQNYA